MDPNSNSEIPTPKKGSGTGPFGFGDPDDRSLRKVEKDVMIPMKIRDKAKAEKCVEEVAAFSACCKDSSIAMVIKCREENAKMKACYTQWYHDPAFIKECEEEYLQERSDYRRTGVKKSAKRYIVT